MDKGSPQTSLAHKDREKMFSSDISVNNSTVRQISLNHTVEACYCTVWRS